MMKHTCTSNRTGSRGAVTIWTLAVATASAGLVAVNFGAGEPGEAPRVLASAEARAGDVVDAISMASIPDDPGNGEGATADGAQLAYSNTHSDHLLPPGGGRRIADDIFLEQECGCVLSSYNFTVSGGGDGSGPGFSVEYAIYDACPSSGGQIIAGTAGTAVFTDDGEHTITVTPPAGTVSIPGGIWLAATFDRNGAGWFMGTYPELGFSDEVFDFPTIPCTAVAGAPLFASFAAQIYCDPGVAPEVHTPNPPDGGADVAPEVVLAWNGGRFAPGTPSDGDQDSDAARAATMVTPETFECGVMDPEEALDALQEAVARGEVPDPATMTLPDVAPRTLFGPPGERISGGDAPQVTADDIFLWEDTSDILANGFSDGALFAMMAQATNAVLAQHGDNFDFVAFWLNFQPIRQIGGAFYSGLENEVFGIGEPIFNSRPGLGVAGENVEGWVMMWNQANWPTGDLTVTQLVFGQEFEHRFGMALLPLPDGRRLQGADGPCGRNVHWNFRVDAQGSGMEVAEWTGADPAFRQGGTLNFNTDIPGSVFAYPDLYLMGYVSPEEMDTFPSELRYMDDAFQCASPYNGPISTWGSADVIAGNGARSPSWFLAQKHFRTAWVMIHRPGLEPTPNHLGRVVNMLNTWNDVWATSTIGRGTMVNVLEEPDPCVTTYDVLLGTEDPPTDLVCRGVEVPMCVPDRLVNDTTYYWQVVGRNPSGQTTGPAWSFTTAPCGSVPDRPQNADPPNGDSNLPLDAILTWNNGVTLCAESFDVLIGTQNPPTTLLCQDVTDTTCDPGFLDVGVTYYWQVIAKTGAEQVPGPIWSFTAETCAVPATPLRPLPLDGTVTPLTGGLLRWNNDVTTITFDGFPDGTPVDGLVIDDVTFSAPQGDANVFNLGGSTGFLSFSAAFGLLDAPLAVDFAIPVYAVSYGFGLFDQFDPTGPAANATTMTLFDDSMNVVAVVSADAANVGFGLAEGSNSWTGQTPIIRAEFTFAHPIADFYGLDDLTYDPLPPPGRGANSDGGATACVTTYDVRFGLDNPPTTVVCEGAGAPVCDPGDIEDDRIYYWQVTAKAPGVETPGPVWSFATPCSIVASDPPNCAIDARQPFDLDAPGFPLGWRFVTLTFNCPVASATFGDFEVSVESGPAPTIFDVDVSGNDVTLRLLEPIPTGQWTCITHVTSGDRVCLAALPGDVNGDGVSTPSDIIAVIDSLNQVVPRPDYAVDVDRSGMPGPPDILRVIDLLNGAGAFAPWLDVSLGACPSQP